MMTAQVSETVAPTIDAVLLAKLTGGLGDRRTVIKIATEIAQLYRDQLPEILRHEGGAGIEVDYVNCESGLMVDLVHNLGKDFAAAECSLKTWAPEFMLAIGNSCIMALMERMLGASPETIITPEQRQLSDIELDMSAVVLSKIAGILRAAINIDGGHDIVLSRPFNSNGKTTLEEEITGKFGLLVRMTVTIGKVESDLCLILPQRALLSTSIIKPKPSAQALKKQEEWMEMISEQVKRSQVTLQARIRLQQLSIGTISRLVEGDVIPFLDVGQENICVEVSANGENMYNCEFGRAGDRYTVRVKNNVSSDDEILRHLMG
jgi:flagellar motor switch protein FliM